MQGDLWPIVISFGLAGLVAGMFAFWLLRINRKVYVAFSERHIAQRVEDWLRRF